jgi:hypothetical protein
MCVDRSPRALTRLGGGAQSTEILTGPDPPPEP